MEAGTRAFHFDMGDGHFVPPVTIGPIVLESIAPRIHELGGIIDCHLMVEAPERHFEAIAQAGGDSVTIHHEACRDLREISAAARTHGLAVGLAFKGAAPPASRPDADPGRRRCEPRQRAGAVRRRRTAARRRHRDLRARRSRGGIPRARRKRARGDGRSILSADGALDERLVPSTVISRAPPANQTESDLPAERRSSQACATRTAIAASAFFPHARGSYAFLSPVPPSIFSTPS